jgi:hypothetical protein
VVADNTPSFSTLFCRDTVAPSLAILAIASG